MAKIYYQEDCNLSLLEGKTIAVIGYGSQGHAHALNAKESGCNVIIGLYEGSKSWSRAEEQGFEVYTASEAAKKADVIMILINDELQAAMYKKDIEPNLEEGNMLMFAHGFNIHSPSFLHGSPTQPSMPLYTHPKVKTASFSFQLCVQNTLTDTFDKAHARSSISTSSNVLNILFSKNFLHSPALFPSEISPGNIFCR